MIGLFGYMGDNTNTGKTDGLILHIVKTNEGLHATIQCDGSVPFVVKLEGESPEYRFSVKEDNSSSCWKSDYVIKLRGHDVLMWLDKYKKSPAMVLPRIQ